MINDFMGEMVNEVKDEWVARLNSWRNRRAIVNEVMGERVAGLNGWRGHG